MNLTPSQISHLKSLIASKGYEEIDVQYEILDHVACKVEEILDENPKLELEEAFRIAHAGFGIFGFSGLEESFKKMIQKRFYSKYKAAMLEFFTSYRLLVLLAVLALFCRLDGPIILFGYQVSFSKLSMACLALAWMGLLLWLFPFQRRFRRYAVFKESLHFMTWLTLLTQVGSLVWQMGKVPESETGSSPQFLVFWIATVVIWLGLVSIFVLHSILKETIAETERLKKIYEA